MILVDVHALQLGEVYDFEVDEDKTADELLGDIVSLICKKENKKINNFLSFVNTLLQLLPMFGKI